MRPLCFVLMPFGVKSDESGRTIDFNGIYHDLIKPALERAGLEPIRADEERTGGMIHKPMFERLLFCDYAVADLTTANANVFYELGVRHAVRPFKTALIFAGNTRLPFDIAGLRAIPYSLDANGGLSRMPGDLDDLSARLESLKAESAIDSPLFQLFTELTPPRLAHEKTDVFRDRVRISQEIGRRLKAARKQGDRAVETLRAIETELGEIAQCESGIVVDLFLSYRAVEAQAEMVRLAERMARPLFERAMIQEQYAWALNACGRGEEAEEILKRVVERFGPGSETYGLLGRVYKDRWQECLCADRGEEARACLALAVETYIKGFEADWRDAYPGINAVTLLDQLDPDDPRKKEILPVVVYAVKRKIARGNPDYWDYATLLELAVLAADRTEAERYIGQVLAQVREKWEPKSTARSIGFIRESMGKRGIPTDWIERIEEKLRHKAEE